MTVDNKSRSNRRKRKPKGSPSGQDAASWSKNPHQVQEHSFGNHASRNDGISGGTGYVTPEDSDVPGLHEVNKDNNYSYTEGYEDRIKSIADAISVELSEVYGGPGYPNKHESLYGEEDYYLAQNTLPAGVQEELQSLLNAAVKVGDVIRHFHDVANRTNLFALKLTTDAMRTEKGGKDLAVQVKNLAEETYVSAEKIYACMYSIQQTLVSIADNRFDEYKHIPIREEEFRFDREKNANGGYKALDSISPRTLKSLVMELDKLRNSNASSEHYRDLGNFATQLSNEIENLREQLQAG